jgi:hypothetical protein
MNIIRDTEKHMLETPILQLSRECALLLMQLCDIGIQACAIFNSISKNTVLWLSTHKDTTLHTVGSYLQSHSQFYMCK